MPGSDVVASVLSFLAPTGKRIIPRELATRAMDPSLAIMAQFK
jgi:hypothetical protein